MATITTDTYLDDGTARTAGEAWTMNGGILTVRTDTRVHANAPAAMTGSFGAMTISSTRGGGVLIDARNVRWLEYDTGAGVVPAIGTIITQGGVSGYLLGVWSALNAAPTADGAAMPATGYLKFREVTGGSFAAGVLTGIAANAVAADKVGWIEVVQRRSVANSVPRLGFYRTRGDWFELGTTNGSAGQTFQVPTNGGGSGTHVPAIWIETSAGSGEYEIFPCVLSTWFNNTNLGTDHRSKFVQTVGDGVVRIGNDGTNNCGYVPPSGCKVRIPNILGRQCDSGTDAVNQTPHETLATRPDFATAAAGVIDFEYFMNDWYHLFSSPYSVTIKNSATFDIHSSSNEASPCVLENYTVGGYRANTVSLTMTSNSFGGTITNCRFSRPSASTNGHSIIMTGCAGLKFSNVHSGVIQYDRSTGRFQFARCSDFLFDDFVSYQTAFVISNCSGFTVTNYNYIDRIIGISNSTTPNYAVQIFASSSNITIDGVILSTVADLSPYSGVFNVTDSTNITLRNCGTFESPVDVNADAAPAYIYVDGGNNNGVRVQRCYLEATRTGIAFTRNTSKNIDLENILGTVGNVVTAFVDATVRGVRAASNSVAGQASVYGTHWQDMFVSDTEGRVWLAFNEPTAATASQYEAVSLGVGAGFTSTGQISMPNLGDQIIFTMPDYVIGHTAFQNVAPTLTGTNTGNFSYEYDIDTGSGFTGTYKTLDGANLSAEVISASTGFKLKIRITVTTAHATNALTYIRVTTDSTALAQQNNLYPLDYYTANITGLSGHSVVLVDSLGAVLDYEASVTGSWSYTLPFTTAETLTAVVKKAGYTHDTINFTTSAAGNDTTAANTAIRLAPDGSNLYQGTSSPLCSISFTGTTQANIDIADGTVSLQAALDESEVALCTQSGLVWLASDLNDISIFTSGGGDYLFLSDGWRLRRASVGDANATIQAFVTSSEGSIVDDVNGDVQFLTSNAPSAIAAAVRVELATELARIDTTISSRLAAADYTAPDNSGISDIKAKTDNLPSDPAKESSVQLAIGLSA